LFSLLFTKPAKSFSALSSHPYLTDIDSPAAGSRRFNWVAQRAALLRGGGKVYQLRLIDCICAFLRILFFSFYELCIVFIVVKIASFMCYSFLSDSLSIVSIIIIGHFKRDNYHLFQIID